MNKRKMKIEIQKAIYWALRNEHSHLIAEAADRIFLNQKPTDAGFRRFAVVVDEYARELGKKFNK